MKVIQNADYEITLRRFDNGENMTLVPGVEVDVDEETARYLLGMKGVVGGKEIASVENTDGQIAEIDAQAAAEAAAAEQAAIDAMVDEKLSEENET